MRARGSHRFARQTLHINTAHGSIPGKIGRKMRSNCARILRSRHNFAAGGDLSLLSSAGQRLHRFARQTLRINTAHGSIPGKIGRKMRSNCARILRSRHNFAAGGDLSLLSSAGQRLHRFARQTLRINTAHGSIPGKIGRKMRSNCARILRSRHNFAAGGDLSLLSSAGQRLHRFARQTLVR